MATLVGQMRSLEASIKQLEKGIERIVEAMPEYQCLTSIPGGLVYAAGIIAEVGQIERFENQQSWLNMPVYIGKERIW